MVLSGSEIVVDALLNEGIPAVVGVPGHGCLAFVDALRRRGVPAGLRVLQARNEQSAVHLADGYYRATGRPLAVFTSIGPGASNTATGLGTAFVDSTAVLVLAGETHTHMFGRGVLQEIERRGWADLPSVLAPVAKRSWTVVRGDQLSFVMHRAFNTMLTGRPGPVVVSMPMDVQATAVDAPAPEQGSRRPGGRVHGDPHEIERAARALAAAQRPVILAGGGVITAEASAELKRVAELTGAAVVTTMMGKGAFPEDHPMYGWHPGSKGTSGGNWLTRQADVLLAVGCRFADLATSSYRHGVTFNIPPTQLIHVDVDPFEIGKNYPVSVGIVGDARTVLADLAACIEANRLGRAQPEDAYAADVQRVTAAWMTEIAGVRESNRRPVTISRLLKELRAALPRSATVVTSSGNTQAQVFQEVPFYEPRTHISAGGFSTMGFTLPAAIGAAIAGRSQPVVAVLGDGDFAMSLQELHLAVQENLPIVVVVPNNSAWQSIKDLQIDAYGAESAFSTEFVGHDGELCTLRVARLAHDFGAHAQQISDASEVGPAVRHALDQGRPAVIEVMVDREFPYSGNVAPGWWDVPVPAYMRERRRQYELERGEERLV